MQNNNEIISSKYGFSVVAVNGVRAYTQVDSFTAAEVFI